MTLIQWNKNVMGGGMTNDRVGHAKQDIKKKKNEKNETKFIQSMIRLEYNNLLFRGGGLINSHVQGDFWT